MDKKEYLYMIVEEIENSKKLREDSINRKEFYQKISGDKDIIRNLDNNIELANKTIDSLQELIYLPVYEIIQKMSNSDLLKYKKQLLFKIDEDIFKERNKIEQLNNDFIELSNNIQKNLNKYLKYKKDNVLNDENLYSSILECKEIHNKEKNINKELKEHKNNIKEMLNKRNIIDIKTIDAIKEYLINIYSLNNITNELERYKVTRSDEIIVNLCNDLNILDKIQTLIEKYISLNKRVVKKTIVIPSVFNSDYKIKNKSINNFILNNCIYEYNKSNEIVITDNKDFDIIKDNIKNVIKDINNNKNMLIHYKIKLEKLKEISFNYINKELIGFISNLCDTLYLTELEKNKINVLYKKYKKLINKKYKTDYSIEKSIKIENELKNLISDILDVYWGILCDDLESLICNLKNNVEFIDDIYNYNIHKGKNKVLFDINNFSEIGLLNMRTLVENILSNISEINNELNCFSKDLDCYKDNLKTEIKDNENNLIDIKNKIDELYYSVSPNDFPILLENYKDLNKIFNDKSLIDSIVKINRKNLISKVRSESVNYRDKDNVLKDDIEVIKKKVLNKE